MLQIDHLQNCYQWLRRFNLIFLNSLFHDIIKEKEKKSWVSLRKSKVLQLTLLRWMGTVLKQNILFTINE